MHLNSIAADQAPLPSPLADATSQQGTVAGQDLILVERVLRGETTAFEAIVQRWQGPLINLAWRYCRDRARAEEMAQEAFVRAWRGLAQWRREGSFSTWLFSVAANVYRTELKRIPPMCLSLDQVAEPACAGGQEAGQVTAAREEAVRRAVLALPENYREPLILFYFHEMDLAAAAATLGLPEGTMKARLSRARDLLRQRFPELRQQWSESGSPPGWRLETGPSANPHSAQRGGKQ